MDGNRKRSAPQKNDSELARAKKASNPKRRRLSFHNETSNNSQDNQTWATEQSKEALETEEKVFELSASKTAKNNTISSPNIGENITSLFGSPPAGMDHKGKWPNDTAPPVETAVPSGLLLPVSSTTMYTGNKKDFQYHGKAGCQADVASVATSPVSHQKEGVQENIESLRHGMKPMLQIPQQVQDCQSRKQSESPYLECSGTNFEPQQPIPLAQWRQQHETAIQKRLAGKDQKVGQPEVRLQEIGPNSRQQDLITSTTSINKSPSHQPDSHPVSGAGQFQSPGLVPQAHNTGIYIPSYSSQKIGPAAAPATSIEESLAVNAFLSGPSPQGSSTDSGNSIYTPSTFAGTERQIFQNQPIGTQREQEDSVQQPIGVGAGTCLSGTRANKKHKIQNHRKQQFIMPLGAPSVKREDKDNEEKNQPQAYFRSRQSGQSKMTPLGYQEQRQSITQTASQFEIPKVPTTSFPRNVPPDCERPTANEPPEFDQAQQKNFSRVPVLSWNLPMLVEQPLPPAIVQMARRIYGKNCRVIKERNAPELARIQSPLPFNQRLWDGCLIQALFANYRIVLSERTELWRVLKRLGANLQTTGQGIWQLLNKISQSNPKTAAPGSYHQYIPSESDPSSSLPTGNNIPEMPVPSNILRDPPIVPSQPQNVCASGRRPMIHQGPYTQNALPRRQTTTGTESASVTEYGEKTHQYSRPPDRPVSEVQNVKPQLGLVSLVQSPQQSLAEKTPKQVIHTNVRTSQALRASPSVAHFGVPATPVAQMSRSQTGSVRISKEPPTAGNIAPQAQYSRSKIDQNLIHMPYPQAMASGMDNAQIVNNLYASTESANLLPIEETGYELQTTRCRPTQTSSHASPSISKTMSLPTTEKGPNHSTNSTEALPFLQPKQPYPHSGAYVQGHISQGGSQTSNTENFGLALVQSRNGAENSASLCEPSCQQCALKQAPGDYPIPESQYVGPIVEPPFTEMFKDESQSRRENFTTASEFNIVHQPHLQAGYQYSVSVGPQISDDVQPELHNPRPEKHFVNNLMFDGTSRTTILDDEMLRGLENFTSCGPGQVPEQGTTIYTQTEHNNAYGTQHYGNEEQRQEINIGDHAVPYNEWNIDPNGLFNSYLYI